MSRYSNINGSLVPIAGYQVADDALSTTSDHPIQNAVVAETVNALNEYGCKNLLPNEAVAKAEDGITWTVNSDGTVIANGTASSNTRLYLNQNVDGSGWSNKILSGSIGGTDDTYYIVIQQLTSPYNTYARCMSGEVVIPEISGNVQCFIYIKSGTVCNNLTFRPMIRDARFTNADYVPFAMSNRDVTKQITAGNSVGDVFKPRWRITGSPSANDTSFMDLPAGTYMVAVNNTSYFPTQWGTLILFKTGDNYNTMLFSATNGNLYFRNFNISDHTYYTNWRKITDTVM